MNPPALSWFVRAPPSNRSKVFTGDKCGAEKLTQEHADINPPCKQAFSHARLRGDAECLRSFRAGHVPGSARLKRSQTGRADALRGFPVAQGAPSSWAPRIRPSFAARLPLRSRRALPRQRAAPSLETGHARAPAVGTAQTRQRQPRAGQSRAGRPSPRAPATRRPPAHRARLVRAPLELGRLQPHRRHGHFQPHLASFRRDSSNSNRLRPKGLFQAGPSSSAQLRRDPPCRRLGRAYSSGAPLADPPRPQGVQARPARRGKGLAGCGAFQAGQSCQCLTGAVPYAQPSFRSPFLVRLPIRSRVATGAGLWAHSSKPSAGVSIRPECDRCL